MNSYNHFIYEFICIWIQIYEFIHEFMYTVPYEFFHIWSHMFHEFINEFRCTKVPDGDDARECLISKVPIANPCEKSWFSHLQILAKVHLQKIAKACETINCERLWNIAKRCDTIFANLRESLRKPAKSYLRKLAKPKYFCERIFAKACKNTCI